MAKVFSAAGVEIVARPYLVEDELSTLAQTCSEDWIRWLQGKGLLSSETVPISVEMCARCRAKVAAIEDRARATARTACPSCP